MRVFKFRAWNKTNSTMERHEDLFESQPYYQNPFMRSDLVLMQYTELQDKNGKEVYEGDVLKVKLNEERTELYPVKSEPGEYHAGG